MDETLNDYRRAARATDDPDLARVLTEEADAISRQQQPARCPMCDSPMSNRTPERCMNADCGNWEGPH